MVDKWEWDTFEIINQERGKHNFQLLGWCCGLESNIRGSCGGKRFVKIPLKAKTSTYTCQHWTSPQTIADSILKRKLFSVNVLDPKYKSGIVIITNDNTQTYIAVACGIHNAISWDNLCNNYQQIIDHKAIHYRGLHCPKCGSGNIGTYDSHSGTLYCARCGYIAGRSNPASDGEDGGVIDW